MKGEFLSIETAEKLAKLEKENEELQRQLDYIRSDEYLKQIRWERDYNEQLANDLKEIINKAIEYINNGYLSDGEMVNILAQQDLLNILESKGE